MSHDLACFCCAGWGWSEAIMEESAAAEVARQEAQAQIVPATTASARETPPDGAHLNRP